MHGIVCLSRLLIRPGVACRNLASRVLRRALARLLEGFEARYGYRPWLVESFVDTSCYSGAFYRAVNWTRVGRTQGRGRLGFPEGTGLRPLGVLQAWAEKKPETALHGG